MHNCALYESSQTDKISGWVLRDNVDAAFIIHEVSMIFVSTSLVYSHIAMAKKQLVPSREYLLRHIGAVSAESPQAGVASTAGDKLLQKSLGLTQ